MKNTVKGFLALMMMLPLALNSLAQEGGNVKLEKTVEGFNAIEMDQSCKMLVSQGDNNSVTVEGPKEVVEAMKVVVKDGVLSIDNAGKSLEGVVINVVAKNLTEIEVGSAAIMESASELKFDNLEIEAEGAADVNLQLNVNVLESDASGAASLKLRGMAQQHNAEVSGAATLNAVDLQTKKTTIDVSGAGNAKVDATEELKGEVSGAGSLYNKSQPQTMNIEESGAGSVVTDTTKLRFGDKEVMIFDDKCPGNHGEHPGKCGKSDKVKPQWAGLELGLNGYMNKDFGFDLPEGNSFFEPQIGRSMSLGLNIFEIGIPIVKKHMNIVTGLGFEFNNYYYKNNYVMLSDTSVFTASMVPGENFDKNKLTVSWVRIPVLLQFDSKQDKGGNTFHFSMGVIGSMKMCSHTKQLWEAEDTRYRMVTRDDYNLSPFKADATVRIGYGYLNLFMNYSLNSMFRKETGPQLFPVSAGITLINI